MSESAKTLEAVLDEVRDKLNRLNNELAPSLPRYSSHDGLRIVEQNRSEVTKTKPRVRPQAA